MAHKRSRHISELVTKSMKFSPITGLLGHRQVGKTTLAQTLADHYQTLDLPESLALAQSNGLAFISQNQAHPLVIDECQLAPALFPALKEWVRTHPKPGQFLLTGSVRFTSRKAIRESLTGRIISWELLPMDWAETHQTPLSTAIPNLLKKLKCELKSHPAFNLKYYRESIQAGGLPGVFGIRDAAIRSQRYETQLNTILERDLKLLIQTTLPYSTLRKILFCLATQVGKSLNLSEVQRKTRVSLPTLRKLIPCMESLFLIRQIPSEGFFKSPVIYFEDIGEYHYLIQKQPDALEQFQAFIYHHLRTQLHYRPDYQQEIFSFREQSGTSISFCIRSKLGTIAFIPSIDEFEQSLRNAENFIHYYENRGEAVTAVIVELEEKVDQLITSKIRRLHISQLL